MNKRELLPPQTWKLYKRILPVIFGNAMAQVIERLPELRNKHINPPDCLGVYLHGEVGTGKTTTAIRLAMAVLKDMVIADRAKPTNAQRTASIILDMLTLDDFPVKLQMAIEKKEFGKLMSYYFTIEILIIDDLFSKNNENVNAIIKERYKNGLITIFTSNFSPEGALEKMDDSIMRRIIDKCKMYKCEQFYNEMKLQNISKL